MSKSKRKANANVLVERVTRREEDEESEAEPVETYAEITAAVQEQLDERLKQVEAETTSKIQAAVKRAMERQSTSTATSKKPKKDPEFKSKGNKKRYEVNDEVISQIEGAIDDIGRNEVDQAKEKLEAGKKTLLKQQKLIRLADREESGWRVVEHYISDDLASDSDDEKAIAKARKEALASIKKRKSKGSPDFRNRFGRDRWSSRDEATRKPWQGRFDRTYKRKSSDVCFRCFREGHWQNACPNAFKK